MNNKFVKFFAKIKDKLFDSRNIILAALIILSLITVVLTVIFLLPQKFNDIAASIATEAKVEQNLFRRYLDGVLVSEKEKNLFPFALTIENIVESRPQSGLVKAKLVIEAPVEGGITRLLAFYDGSEDLSEIGPIRSARPYFLDWAAELKALYVHVGGSPEALTMIKRLDILNLNQFFKYWYFWRSNKRYAPHNVYSSTKLLLQAAQDKDLDNQGNFEVWKFKDDLVVEKRPQEVKDIIIDYSTPEYKVEWKYDPQNNSYLRYQAGAPHLEVGGGKIMAKNVIIQFAEVKIIDEEGRRQIKTVSANKALIFRDGQTIVGTWKKEERNTRTKFYDELGQEIEFNAGQTWIELVPVAQEKSVIY